MRANIKSARRGTREIKSGQSAGGIQPLRIPGHSSADRRLSKLRRDQAAIGGLRAMAGICRVTIKRIVYRCCKAAERRRL